MNFRTPPEDELELNLIPLIDVLLVTIIFLMVTTSFSKEAQLRIRLPEASTEARTNQPALRIAIDARGQYYINEQQLLHANADVLRNAIARAVGNQKDPLVIIQADAKTPHEAVVRVMDVARRLGLTQLTFATQQPADAPAP